MLRQNKLAIVSHCILNQNSVVQNLARARGAFQDIMAVLIKAGLGIYQLPCPEMAYLGMQRKPQTYHEYSTPEYNKLCETIAYNVLRELEFFSQNGAEITALMGINNSPTCSLSGTVGHLFRILMPELLKRYPGILIIDVPQDYVEDKDHEFITCLEKLLKNGY